MTSPFDITVAFAAPPGSAKLLAPRGLDTPQTSSLGCTVSGATISETTEATTGQRALILTPDSDRVELRYRFAPDPAAYPDAMFAPRQTRFTRAAEDLTEETAEIAPDADPLARAQAIARATAERFTYGHPEEKFNDGLDHVPALGCGIAEGSCVDINTYFIAALRAAGIEAGYVTGYFFPAEKRDHCEDMHCWVVTRIGGEVQDWDIAHHLKLGTRDIRPALNPKPGFRAAMAHSMGLDFPELGIREAKLIAEPMWIDGSALRRVEGLSIRLHHPDLPGAEGSA